MCDISEKYRKKLKRVKECYDEIITEMKKEDVNNFVVKDWFDEKEIIHKSIVFIFACPGKDEFIEDMPCFGQTGKNLDGFISHLKGYLTEISEEYKKEFQLAEQINEDNNQSADNKEPKYKYERYKYVILNSSDKVHFDELTSNSEPNCSEIKTKVNNDLKDTKKKELIQKAKFIFCFGGKAKKYYDKIKEKLDMIKPIECCHLGNQALNKTYSLSSDEIKDSKARKERRIELLFNDVKPKIDDILTGASAGDLNSSSQGQKI